MAGTQLEVEVKVEGTVNNGTLEEQPPLGGLFSPPWLPLISANFYLQSIWNVFEGLRRGAHKDQITATRGE